MVGTYRSTDLCRPQSSDLFNISNLKRAMCIFTAVYVAAWIHFLIIFQILKSERSPSRPSTPSTSTTTTTSSPVLSSTRLTSIRQFQETTKNRKKDQQLNQLKQSDKSVNGGSPASEHSNKTGKTIHTTFHDVSVNFEYSTLEKKIWRRTGQSLQVKVIVFNLQRMPTLNKKCLLSSSKFCFLK